MKKYQISLKTFKESCKTLSTEKQKKVKGGFIYADLDAV